MVFRSTKLFTGYSSCFRQWRATESHCQFLHGYAMEFKVTFAGDLDDRNWVVDFGRFKGDGIKEWLSDKFDHTCLVASDDPLLEYFEGLDNKGLVQLIILPDVGCEKFAEYVYTYIAMMIDDDRVWVEQVECMENGKNSAIFGRSASRSDRGGTQYELARLKMRYKGYM